MSTVFIAMIPVGNDAEAMQASPQDDAAEIHWINLDDLDNSTIAFDHKKILFDYKVWKQSSSTFWSSKNMSSTKAV